MLSNNFIRSKGSFDILEVDHLRFNDIGVKAVQRETN